ncbi:MAG: hemolysin family protein [Actinomycetota bacterium]
MISLGAVIALIAANGAFVAGEFSLVAVDRAPIDRMADEGRRPARLTRGLLQRLSFHLSGMQLGITVTSLVLGLISEGTVGELIRPVLEAVGVDNAGTRVVVALVVATFVQMLIGELIPKNVAIARPQATAFALAGPLTVFGTVAGPVTGFLDGLANRIIRTLGIEPVEELHQERSQEEMELLLRSSMEDGNLDADEAALLIRALRFDVKTTAEALVPRTRVVSLAARSTVDDARRLAIDSGRSRLLVHGADLDDVVGIVAVTDVLRVPAEERASTHVLAVTRPATVVTETRALGPLLGDLRSSGDRLAVVVDEHGGTEGLVSLEDLLEELVGEIHDEHDVVPRLTEPLATGSQVVDASLHRDELLDLAGFAMPDGDYETLAGFVLERLGHIPDVGEEIEAEGWRFRVVERDRLRVARVELERLGVRGGAR